MSAEIEGIRKDRLHPLYLFSIPLGILADILFYGKSFGVSFPIFIVAYMLLFYREPILSGGKKAGNIWILSYIFFLSLTFALFSNGTLLFLNLLLVLLLVAAHDFMTLGDGRYDWGRMKFVRTVSKKISGALFSATGFFSNLMPVLTTPFSRASGTARSVLMGLGISLPLLIVVISLLSSADMVFSNMIGKLLDFDIAAVASHTVYVVLVSAILFGYMIRQMMPLEDASEEAPAGKDAWSWDQVFASTVLTGLNLTYLAFTIVQFSYLFGGQESGPVAGMNYSEYARRGFFELLAVSAINLCVITASLTRTKNGSARGEIVLNGLYILLTAFTLVIDYSAHFRLSLYENAYGYTYLRIYSHAVMFFLAILFLSSLTKMIYREFNLTKAYVIVGMAFYLALNYTNVDSVIARKNIERYSATGMIDDYYLAGLSYDAVPYLYQVKDIQNPELANVVRWHLRNKQEYLKSAEEENGWQAFNLSKYRALSVLEQGGF